METIWQVIAKWETGEVEYWFSSEDVALEHFEKMIGVYNRIELWSLKSTSGRFYYDTCLKQHIKD